MAPGPKPVIVRSYSDPNGPTGEGTIHVDSNGRHWREVFRFYDRRGTGDRQATYNPRTGVITEQ